MRVLRAGGLALTVLLGGSTTVTGEDRFGPSVVVVVADGCGEAHRHGMGTGIAAGRVLTAAHVVAGAHTVTVTRGRQRARATLTAVNRVDDLALLAVPDGFTQTRVVGVASADDAGTVTVDRDGQPVVMPVRVRRGIVLEIEDIDLEAVHDRDAIELDAEIAPGDSGAGVIVDGRLVGVVVARDRQRQSTAYAIEPTPIADHLRDTQPVSSGDCPRMGH